jgi:hypothetical protein
MALLRRQPASRQTTPTTRAGNRGRQNGSHLDNINSRQAYNSTYRGHSGSQTSSANLQAAVSLADPADFFAATQQAHNARTGVPQQAQTQQVHTQPSQPSQTSTTVPRSSTLPNGGGLGASRWVSDPSESNLHPESTADAHPPRSPSVVLENTQPRSSGLRQSMQPEPIADAHPFRSPNVVVENSQPHSSGLRQSIWAVPTPSATPETARLPLPLSGEGSSTICTVESATAEITLPASSSQNTIRKFTATAQKGDGPIYKDVTVRLFQVSRLHPILLEIESKEKRRLFCGSIAMNALLEIMKNKPHTLTLCNIAPIVPDLIWTLSFLLPHHAAACYGALTRDPFRPALAERSVTRPAPSPTVAAPPMSQMRTASVPYVPENSHTAMRTPSPEAQEALIDLSEEGPRQEDDVEESSALIDLAPLNDDYMVSAVLLMMNNYYDGSFLETLFENVRFSTLADTARNEDILHSDEHLQVSQALACEYFRQSETFSCLNEAEEEKFLKDMGRKLLAKALMIRSNQNIETLTEYEDTEPFPDSEPSEAQYEYKAKAVLSSGSSVATQSRNEDSVVGEEFMQLSQPRNGQQDLRIGSVYAVDELLSLRNHALNIDRVLLSREEMFKPNHKERSGAVPRFNTSTPTSSVGRSMPPAAPITQVTSAQGWQSFSVRGNSPSQNPTKDRNDGLVLTSDETPAPTLTVVHGSMGFTKDSQRSGSEGSTNVPPMFEHSYSSECPKEEIQDRVKSPHEESRGKSDTPAMNPQVLKLARSLEELNLDNDDTLDFTNIPGLEASRRAAASDKGVNNIEKSTISKATHNFPHPRTTEMIATGQIKPLSNANWSACPPARQENIPYHTFQPRADMLHLRQSSNDSSEPKGFSSTIKHADAARAQLQRSGLSKPPKPAVPLAQPDMQAFVQSRLTQSLSLRSGN